MLSFRFYLIAICSPVVSTILSVPGVPEGELIYLPVTLKELRYD